MSHTPEPWTVKLDGLHCFAANGDMVAACGGSSDTTRPNLIETQRTTAERIVACVNACAGLPDPSVVPELIAALREMTERYTSLVVCGDCGNWDAELEPHVIAARSVLGKLSAGLVEKS